jgi:hypothetical protein
MPAHAFNHKPLVSSKEVVKPLTQTTWHTLCKKRKEEKTKAIISWSSKIEFITYYLYLKKNQYDK